MLFSICGGWKSKQTSGYFLSAHSGRKSMCSKHYFPSVANGKVSKREAIFRPPRMEKKSMRMLFSVHANGTISKPKAIFHLPLTKKKSIWHYFPSTMHVWRLWLMENNRLIFWVYYTALCMQLSNVTLCMRLYTKKSVPNGVLITLNNSCCIVFLLYCIALLDVNKPCLWS